MKPSETILATFPKELVEMMDAYNTRNYVISQNGSRGKNEEFYFDLVHKNQSKLMEVFDREKNKVRDYKKELNRLHTEQEQISIYNMQAYFANQQKGFGRYNDEALFRRICGVADETNLINSFGKPMEFENEKKNTTLLDKVLLGLEISRDYTFLMETVIKYKVLCKVRRFAYKW